MIGIIHFEKAFIHNSYHSGKVGMHTHYTCNRNTAIINGRATKKEHTE